jgi:hypothetical protein
VQLGALGQAFHAEAGSLAAPAHLSADGLEDLVGESLHDAAGVDMVMGM